MLSSKFLDYPFPFRKKAFSYLPNVNNVCGMSSYSKNRMSSFRKISLFMNMQYIIYHSHTCQVETILLAGICKSWKNEINVLKLRTPRRSSPRSSCSPWRKIQRCTWRPLLLVAIRIQPWIFRTYLCLVLILCIY